MNRMWVLFDAYSAFIGNHIFLEEIWRTEGIYFVEKILSADSALEIVDIVESKLKHILSLNDLPSHSLVQTSMKYMYSFKGNMSTSALAEKLNFSERHLRRIFHQELGVSPKEMLGIVRFQSILQDLGKGSYKNLTDIAVKYGYYDQSHFIKSFKRYYGILPKQIISKTD